jgi:hypothetical protein
MDTSDTIDINKIIQTNDMLNGNLNGNTITNTDTINNANINKEALTEPSQQSEQAKKPEDTQETASIFKSIFSASNFILIIWFLGIYFIAYFILGFFFKSSSPSSNEAGMARTIDILMFSCLIIVIITSYYSMTDYQKDNFLNVSLTKLVEFVNEPFSIVSVVSFIIVFYLIIYLFRFTMTEGSKSIAITIIESIAWILFIIIAIVDFFKYFLKIPIMDVLYFLFGWTKTPEEKPVTPEVKGNAVVTQPDEVFNISNNLYTYDDAQAICSSYDAKLATYDQIEEAYNDGAEWCNYGWSDSQMIYFPTQKATWDKLQKTKNHKNDCGRPGVNGGHIANPYLKFGVNCYGKKPSANDNDLLRMKANKDYVFPKSQEDIDLENKVKYWKDNADKLLKVNSFNTNKWFENWNGNTLAK